MKEQIKRELKEVEECKRRYKQSENRKDDGTKKVYPDYKPTGLDPVVSPCKRDQKKDKFSSTTDERISSNCTSVTRMSLSIHSGIINGLAAMCAKY